MHLTQSNEINLPVSVTTVRSRENTILTQPLVYGRYDWDTGMLSHPEHLTGVSPELLTRKARSEMDRGYFRELNPVCEDLYQALTAEHSTATALEFIPVLNEVSLSDKSVARMLAIPAKSLVLIDNSLLKVVLIRWKTGKFSKIHIHPGGEGVISLICGTLEERRYTPNSSSRLHGINTLFAGGMSYIDDNMALHSVGNPYAGTAISLHAYTKGKYQGAE